MIELLFGAPTPESKAKNLADSIRAEREQEKKETIDELKKSLRKAARSENKDDFADEIVSILSGFLFRDDEEEED